jgi:hypothetical protein
MCNTCKIQWIDGNGKATPDNNPAIGRVRVNSYTSQIGDRAITFPTSDWFPICNEHAKALGKPGMHIWQFEAFTVYHPEVA